MCKYKYLDGEPTEFCTEDLYRNSECCILHIPIPENIHSREYNEIIEAKRQKTREKIDHNDFNFEGAKLLEFELRNDSMRKVDIANFTKVEIVNNFTLENIEFYRIEMGYLKIIQGNLFFSDVKIGGIANFRNLQVMEIANLDFKVNESALFQGSYFSRLIFIAEANQHVYFDSTIFGDLADFNSAKIGGQISFLILSFKI